MAVYSRKKGKPEEEVRYIEQLFVWLSKRTSQVLKHKARANHNNLKRGHYG